tara:strand:+ start:597 stop:1925 length:1329 start_codon:yes stop_codon:yes gene_type:complete
MQNKPSFKFKKDDVFISYLQANPKYKIHFYFNHVKINGGLDNGGLFHNKEDTISVFANNQPGVTIAPFLEKDSNRPLHFLDDDRTKAQWAVFSEGTKYQGSYSDITSSLTKEYVIKSGTGADAQAVLTDGVAFAHTLDKLGALKNVYNYYRFLSPFFDFDKYVAENDGLPKTFVDNTFPTPVPDYINFISVPRLYKGNKIKEGSVVLSFFYTGSLIGEARDLYSDGVLYETTGTKVGSVIGTVLYPEGLMTITASHKLSDGLEDGYLSPITSQSVSSDFIDNPKWVHFLSYRSSIQRSIVDGDSLGHIAKYAPASSSYTVEFKGETVVPTYTMFCHADKNDLVWSNNPTFIANTSSFTNKDYHSIYALSSGSHHYEEREKVSIKNIVSSSFTNHSESFSPTTYISKIGVFDEEGDLIAVANLSTPVKKTTKQDYTFKLKLDL